jgi:hypothetical protein
LTVGMVEKREGTLAFAKTFCFAAAWAATYIVPPQNSV